MRDNEAWNVGLGYCVCEDSINTSHAGLSFSTKIQIRKHLWHKRDLLGGGGALTLALRI